MKLFFIVALFALLMPLGMKSNTFVKAENGGKMPVLIDPIFRSYVEDGRHTLLTDDTRYPLLADVIHIQVFHAIFSIGDILIYVGFVFMWMAIFIGVFNVLCTVTNLITGVFR